MTGPIPELRLAVAQFAMSEDREKNLEMAAELIRRAAAQGARVVLLPELFEHPYFPKQERKEIFALATSLEQNLAVRRLSPLARDLQVVLPVSFFEKAGAVYYNSVAVIDADGQVVGVYRKSHIPDGAGYQEKFYFSPGDSGFRVFCTRYARLGIGICWDQWFPECARALTLLGAEALLFPSAIGIEPAEPRLDTRDPWRRVMVGHAVSNSIPVAAANRVGDEEGQVFYGSSFVVDHRGDTLAEMDHEQEGVITASLDLAEINGYRESFGLLGDRRPELYDLLTSSRPRAR